VADVPEPMSPAEVIDDIRTGEFLLDIDSESARVRRGAKSLQGKLNRALTQLSEDLYSKQTHFVLELLQNADDNSYAPGVEPSLTFAISPERLLLRNNEKGFSEGDVRALCDVGKSSKTKKLGYIGEKGIGFKAVFTVSDRPEIHSNGYHFRFDRSDENNLLGFIVPMWCEPGTDGADGVTTIALPAKPDFRFSDDVLAEFDARLLLFLSKLRQLSVETAQGTVIYRRSELAHGLTRLDTVQLPQRGPKLKSSVDFLRVPLEVDMTSLHDDKRPGFPSSEVVLAFPVDTKGAAAPQPTSQVSAFLPVRRGGFRFSVQADFILSASREDIHTDRPWNQALRNAIAPAFRASVARFRNTGRLGFTYLDFLPRESEVLDAFFKPVVGETIRLLMRNPVNLGAEFGTVVGQNGFLVHIHLWTTKFRFTISRCGSPSLGVAARAANLGPWSEFWKQVLDQGDADGRARTLLAAHAQIAAGLNETLPRVWVSYERWSGTLATPEHPCEAQLALCGRAPGMPSGDRQGCRSRQQNDHGSSSPAVRATRAPVP
jgi:hypothetical protein